MNNSACVRRSAPPDSTRLITGSRLHLAISSARKFLRSVYGVYRAATHGRIVGDDHAFDIGDDADPGDDAGADGELGAPCGQAGQLEEWRIRSAKARYVPRKQSTTSVVPIRVVRTAAGDRERQLSVEFGQQVQLGGAVARAGITSEIYCRPQYGGHGWTLTSTSIGQC